MARNSAAAASRAKIEAARNSLEPQQIVSETLKLLVQMRIGYVPVYDAPEDGVSSLEVLDCIDALPVVRWKKPDRDDMSRANFSLKALTALLGKTMPDLKSMEMTDMTDRSEQSLSTEDMAQRLLSIMAKPPKVPGASPLSPGALATPALDRSDPRRVRRHSQNHAESYSESYSDLNTPPEWLN